MSYIDDKFYVLEHIDKRTLLEQLAEEAAELSQAALKLIRAEGLSGNPTNRNALIAREQLNDEVDDVLMIVDALKIPVLTFRIRHLSEVYRYCLCGYHRFP